MRLFSNVVAEYTCTRHCGYHYSSVAPTLSLFHLLAGVIAAVPAVGHFLKNSWGFPWYYLIISTLAGELLFLFLAGFLLSAVCTPIEALARRKCRRWGAPLFFAGRHCDPMGTNKPHWSDIAMQATFIGGNVMCWIAVFCSMTGG